VPVIVEGMFDKIDFDDILLTLSTQGSHAAPGFMQPEGIVIYHVQGNFSLKKTIKGDEIPKSMQLGGGK
jgi:hypothetical protein